MTDQPSTALVHAPELWRERNAERELERIRANMGSLYIAARYPGGAAAMYQEILKAESKVDLQSERADLAMAVLRGAADEYVRAWARRDLGHGELPFCDHCDDLSARLLRSARDLFKAERDRSTERLNRLLGVLRRTYMIRGSEAYDVEAVIKRVADFFGLKEPEQRIPF